MKGEREREKAREREREGGRFETRKRCCYLQPFRYFVTCVSSVCVCVCVCIGEGVCTRGRLGTRRYHASMCLIQGLCTLCYVCVCVCVCVIRVYRICTQSVNNLQRFYAQVCECMLVEYVEYGIQV